MNSDFLDPSEIEEAQQTIAEEVKANHIILYMKGSRIMPMCGFSGRVIDVLEEVDVDFETRDVLKDPALRVAIKEFSDWPTLPQLYIAGEFVGGCDIIMSLYMSGELALLCKGITSE